jgi:hypothetical protein
VFRRRTAGSDVVAVDFVRDTAVEFLQDDRFDRRITYNREETSVREILNIPPSVLNAAVQFAGSRVISASEQSNKSVAEAGIGICSASYRRPCVLLVGDVLQNVASLVDKIKGIYHEMEMDVYYAAGSSASLSTRIQNGIRTGHILVVAQLQVGGINRVTSLIERLGLQDINLVLDEADVSWSTEVQLSRALVLHDPACKTAALRELRDFDMTRRERALYELILKHPTRTITHVSATHMTTLKLHSMLRLAYHAHVADDAALEAKGYALRGTLAPFKDREGDDVFLDHRALADTLQCPEVDAFLAAFGASETHARLMMVAMTPLIQGGVDNAFSIAPDFHPAVHRRGAPSGRRERG